jgi:hypothetical protein
VKTISLDRFGALENFAGASQRLAEATASSRHPSMPAAQLSGVRGRIAASEGNGADKVPLVVRWADGFGEMVFIAVDLDRPPLDRWPALPQLLATLLGQSLSPTDSPRVESATASHLGYDDLSGQLRAALDQFPSVRVTPFWLIAVLAGGYILLLFPLDYWLSRRMKGSAVWPWVSFAAIVVGVSLGASWLGRQLRGDQLQVDQADVVDFDVQSGLTRGRTWFSLFTPASQRPAISLKPLWHGPHAGATEVQLSWLGLPGNGLGGMGDGTSGAGRAPGINAGAATADFPLFTRPYPCSSAGADSAASIGPVPIAACSSKCFTGDWIDTQARLVEADLHEQADHQLAGVVRLAAGMSQDPQAVEGTGQGSSRGSGAGFHLTECVLFYDRWAYLIPQLPATEAVDMQLLDPRTAETYFTHRKTDQTTPYDRAGLDRSRILELMMFYRAAGGLQYVGLLNRYQHFLDLSGHLLGLDRAILIGFGPPASELTVDGRPLPADASAEHVTIYRFLLPVRTAESDQRN